MGNAMRACGRCSVAGATRRPTIRHCRFARPRRSHSRQSARGRIHPMTRLTLLHVYKAANIPHRELPCPMSVKFTPRTSIAGAWPGVELRSGPALQLFQKSHREEGDLALVRVIVEETDRRIPRPAMLIYFRSTATIECARRPDRADQRNYARRNKMAVRQSY